MRNRIDFNFDKAAIDTFADLITPYVERESRRLSQTYTWKIPDGVPVASFSPCGLSSAEANIQLKRSLSKEWHLDGSDRAALAR